jgi:hypothetical protein
MAHALFRGRGRSPSTTVLVGRLPVGPKYVFTCFSEQGLVSSFGACDDGAYNNVESVTFATVVAADGT